MRDVANYHLSVSPVSRSAGRSAVAAAAYRAGARLRDERTGQTHDYTRRRGVLAADVVAPPGCIPFERERLWQAVEAAEKRRDACVAREVRLALPAELDQAAARDLARQFGQWLAARYQTVVDVAVHAPDRSGDERNIHAHILMPTRQVGQDGALGAKLRMFNDPRTGPAEIEAMRVAWEEFANRALAAAGSDARIDHRSLAEQGIDRAPTVHLGPAATAIERRTGEPSQIRERAEEAAQRAEEARAAILDEQQAAAARVVRLRERLAEARQALAAERAARQPSAVVRRAWSWVTRAAEEAAKAAAGQAAAATRQAAEGLRQAAAVVVRRAAAMTKAAGKAWRERMRQRQAAITRAKQGAAAARPAPRPAPRPAERPRVDEEAREAARHVDLARWCQAQGLTVEPDGRDHWRVRGPGSVGLCRITQRPGERPVWVAWDGGAGGDAIAFVQWWQPGTSYREAVQALAGALPAPTPARSSKPEPARPTRPTLPAEADREAGRRYLKGRGLDEATLDAAERSGVLRYTSGAVLLVARDESGEVRHVLRRGYLSDDPHPKRALAGSDTAHPVVLPGDPSRVVVVEGPVTGLAVHSLAQLRGEPVPTVVVTGGVAMRRWVSTATDLLRGADVVEIAAEREGDPERQEATDAARERLAATIEDVTGRRPRITWPAPGCGDLADELAARRAEEKRRREQAEEDAARKAEEERRRQAEDAFLRRLEEARRRTEAAARWREAEERRRAPEERRAEEQRRLQIEEQRRRQAEEQRREQERKAEEERRRQAAERARHTPEARRQAILEEEMKAAARQFAQARTSWEREAVEQAARMRAMDRWRAEGIAPQEPRPSRRRQHDEHWEPPAPRL